MQFIIRFSLALIILSALASSCQEEILNPIDITVSEGALDTTIASHHDEVERQRQIREQRHRDSLDSVRLVDIALARDTFDDAVCGGLSVPDDPNHMDRPEATGPPRTSTQNGIRCEETTYRWELGMENAFLYDPTTDIFFPGSLLYGSSLASGAYRPVGGQRAPLTGSISLENITGSPVFTVENPTLANVREAIANMLRDLGVQGTPAKMNFEMERVFSSEQAALSVRGSGKGFGVRVAASFDWSNTEVKTRLVVNFQQLYYSLDVDMNGKEPSDLFVEDGLPDINDFNGEMPVYVSSIKYGRQVVFSIESSHEASAVQAAVQASYNGLVSGSLTVAAHHAAVLNSSKISAYVVGGSGEIAAENISSGNTLMNIMNQGGNYAPDSPGAPLSFTMRYLCDNSIAKVALASEYTVRQCTEVGEEWTVRPFDGNWYGPKLCPYRTNDEDRDFDGRGPKVDGRIILSIGTEGGLKRVYANIEVDMIQIEGDTKGKIKEKILIATLPEGVTSATFATDPVLHLSYIDTDHTPDRNEIQVIGDLLADLIINGDTNGDDIEHCDDGDSYMKVKFAPITLNLRY